MTVKSHYGILVSKDMYFFSQPLSYHNFSVTRPTKEGVVKHTMLTGVVQVDSYGSPLTNNTKQVPISSGGGRNKILQGTNWCMGLFTPLKIHQFCPICL